MLDATHFQLVDQRMSDGVEAYNILIWNANSKPEAVLCIPCATPKEAHHLRVALSMCGLLKEGDFCALPTYLRAAA